MRAEVEFFRKFEKPVPLDSLKLRVTGEDFSTSLSAEDKRAIEDNWGQMLLKHTTIFSKPQGLATFYGSGDTLSYMTTDYANYAAVSRTHEKRTLSNGVYENMRVAAIGAALRFEDGSIFVHRRSYEATHVAGVIDSSCAGVCFVRDGSLSPSQDLAKKCEKELKLEAREYAIEGVSAVHRSYAPDFRGMIDVVLRSNIGRDEFLGRVEGSFPESWIIEEKEMPDLVFIILQKKETW